MSARTQGPLLLALAWLLCTPVAAAGQDGDGTGFVEVDPALLEGPAYYDPARFPDAGNSVFHPDADLPAPVRATLLVDAAEGDVHHARYRVRYDLVPPATDGGEPVAMVEVVRFNLGPARRADLARQDPGLPLAPPEAFGTGPHVAYRFRMGPVQGMQSSIHLAERRELDDAEAREMSCLGQPCLELVPSAGPDGTWQPLDPAPPPLPFEASDGAGKLPAAVLAYLHDALGEDALRPVPAPEGGDARLEFILELDAWGQAGARQGLARNSVVFDDQMGTFWVQWREAESGGAEASMLAVPR